MPTFEFTSPEGKTYEVEGPEGSTHEQAFEVLQKQLGAQQPTEPVAPAKPTLKQRLIGDDPMKEIGLGIGRLPAETANLIDMGLSVFGQALGVGADLGMRAIGTMHGFDNRTVGLMGQKLRQDVSEPFTNPLHKLAGGIDALMQKFGHEPKLGKGYEKSQIYEVMNKVGGLVQQGGDKVEKATGGLLTSADVDTFTQILMLGLGTKGLETAQPKLDKLGRVTQDTLPVLTDKQRAAEAPKPAAPKPVVNAAKIDELIGVKSATERATANKARREDVRKAVAEDPDLADYYAFKAEERARQAELPQPERAVVEENFPQPKEVLPDVPPDVMIADALGNVAKTPKELAILNDPGTQAAIAAYQAKKNQPGYGVMKGQRGAADFGAHEDMVKFLRELGFDKPEDLAKRMAAGVDQTKQVVENNASGESAASLEAQSRVAVEKAKGQTRLLVERDGTVRPLVGVDAVDQVAKPGQVILQKGVGKDEWTVLGKGTGLGPYAVEAAKNAAGRYDLNKFAKTLGGSVAEGVRNRKLAIDRAAQTGGYRWNAGDQIYSAKTGKTYEIVARNIKKDGTPTYHYKTNDGESGDFIADKAHESLKLIGGPSAQRGIADPKDLAKVAAVGTAAVIGSNLTDDPIFGGLTAAAFTAAGLYGGAKAKTLAAEAVRGLDYAGGNISTRIGNMSQAVLHRAREYERGVLTRTHGLLDKAHPFIERLDKVKGEKGQVLARAILTNDPVAIKAALDAVGDSRLSSEFSNVRKMLEEVGKELQAHGRVGNLRENYFPRMVKDLNGLMQQLGAETRTRLQKALNDANVESLRKTGAPLSDLEQTTIINRALTQSVDGMKGKPGFSKARQIDKITAELQPFYASPVESLHSYLSLAAKDLEKAKFFGKDLARTDGKIDLQASIGNVVKRELDAGNITFAQADELGSILRSRFGPGEASSAGLIQDVKNWINAGLLGNVVSAATQLGDVGTTAAIQGLRPTMEGVVRQLSGNRRVNMKDFGLADHISEEFVSTRKSAKFLNATFRLGLFTAVDKFGKNVSLEAALSKLQTQAKTVGGMRALERKYGEAFGEDFQTLAAELRSGKVGDQTRAALFSELSDMQPITRLEVPQAYLDMPNGRAVYMLKTFMLKQFDIVRREAYNEIRRGNVAQGVKNLTRYAVALGVAGATTDMLKNWLLGREIDFDTNDLSKNILKTFGWTEYVADQAKKGDVVKAVGGTFVPPYKMFDDMYKAAGGGEMSDDARERAREKVVQYIPVFGKLFESHLLGGAERFDAQQAKRKAKEVQ